MEATSWVYLQLNKNIDERNRVVSSIQNILDKKTQGAMVRARTMWYQYGEKPTKYFLKLEQTNHTKKK